MRRLEQLEPIGLGSRKRLFVRKNDSRGVILQADESDESPAPHDGPSASRPAAFLVVAVERRLAFRNEGSALNPITESLGGAGIDVVLRGITGLLEAANHANDVEWTGGVITRLHLGTDLVVGLGHHRFELADYFGVKS